MEALHHHIKNQNINEAAALILKSIEEGDPAETTTGVQLCWSVMTVLLASMAPDARDELRQILDGTLDFAFEVIDARKDPAAHRREHFQLILGGRTD